MARTDAKTVIAEIIRRTDGEFSGKTRLFKAFYFSHLAYYDKNPGILTDWPIARMPEGPGIDRSHALFREMIQEGLLQIELIHDGFYPEYRYRLTEKGRAMPEVAPDVGAAIQRVVDYVRDKTGSELSQYTHEHSRSWKEASDGAILDIYVDLIGDEYQQREAEIDDLTKKCAKLFAG